MIYDLPQEDEKETVTKRTHSRIASHLAADASRLAALRKLGITRYACTIAPCQPGASTIKNCELFLA
jgi:hypothetical protein